MQMFRKYSTYKYFLSNTPYTTFYADAFRIKKKTTKSRLNKLLTRPRRFIVDFFFILCEKTL